MATPFKCNGCECEGLSYKRIKYHKGEQHKIGAQVDGIDNELIIEEVTL